MKVWVTVGTERSLRSCPLCIYISLHRASG